MAKTNKVTVIEKNAGQKIDFEQSSTRSRRPCRAGSCLSAWWFSGSCRRPLLRPPDLPSVMVYIPAFKNSDVLKGGNDSIHPAFIVNGQQIPGFYPFLSQCSRE